MSFAAVELWLGPVHVLREHLETSAAHCDSHGHRHEHSHGECCGDSSREPEHDHPASEHEDLPNPHRLIAALPALRVAIASLPPMVPGPFASVEQPALPSRLSAYDWSGPRGPPLGNS